MLHEAVDALNLRPGSIVVDCTFGRGGHSRLIAERLSQFSSAQWASKRGRLIALDKDPDAVSVAAQMGRAIEGVRFECVHAGFAALDQVLDGCGVDDGVIDPTGCGSLRPPA